MYAPESMHLSFSRLAILPVLYCCCLAAYRLWIHPANSIPGPFLARVSILWQLWHVLKGDYRLAVRRAHRDYGPLVRISYNEVSVCNDEAIRKILIPSLDKGDWYRIFAMPDSSFVNQMSELKASKFAKLQKKIIKAYSLAQILEHEQDIDSMIGLFEENMDHSAKDPRSGFVSLNRWFSFYAFDLVGISTFSQDFGFLKTGQDVGDCCATSDQLIGYLAVMSFFSHIHDMLQAFLGPILAYFNLQPMQHVMQTTIDAISHREKSLQPHNDMVSIWRSRTGPDPITDQEVFNTANANVAAGADTTCSAMLAFVYYVLRNPQVKAKLIDELRAAVAQGSISSPVQYKDTLDLPYFQACWKEVLRFHPISAHGIPRIVPPEGIDFNGQFLASGTIVSVSQWALHHDKSLFGDDASEFKPDRWLTGDTTLLTKNWIPFGAGYMTCPGRHLATVEAVKLLATLFIDYDITLADPSREWTIRETILVKGQDWQVRMVRTDIEPSAKNKRDKALA